MTHLPPMRNMIIKIFKCLCGFVLTVSNNMRRLKGDCLTLYRDSERLPSLPIASEVR